MVKIYQQPFAHAGTKQVIPDSSDPQGFVSNEDGFTTDYELPDTDPNYKPIERAEFNGLMSMVTEAVGELQQFGFAKWQPMQWPQGARVVEGGVVYRSLVQTSQQPPHADWADESPIGVGQTWQDVTGSRVAETTYTNTTGRPIAVSIVANGTTSSTGAAMSLIVGGEGVYSSPAYAAASACSLNNVVVPAGATYQLERGGLTSVDSIRFWKELR